jgi:protein-S-isoprenylcysteine O-methyltransferase Ste14
MQDKSATVRRKRKWWRAVLGVVAAVALVILVMNPELAALGFLFDPIMLDVAILLFGMQMLLFSGQIRTFITATCSSIVRHLKTLRLRG